MDDELDALRDAQRILGGQPHAEDAARLDGPAAACARGRLREQRRRAVQQAGDPAAARREPVVGVVGDEACAVAALGAQRGERPEERREARVGARDPRGIALLLDGGEQRGLAWLGLGVGVGLGSGLGSGLELREGQGLG